jgi:hypothetical protein
MLTKPQLLELLRADDAELDADQLAVFNSDRFYVDGKNLNDKFDNPNRWLEIEDLLDELAKHPKMSAVVSRWEVELDSQDAQDLYDLGNHPSFITAAVEDVSRCVNKDGSHSVSYFCG